MPGIRVKLEQWDHETVVDIPTLDHGPIHTLVEAALDEIPGKPEIAGDTAIRYAEISRSGFDRARKGVKYCDLLWIAQFTGVHDVRQMRRRHPEAKLRHYPVSLRRPLL